MKPEIREKIIDGIEGICGDLQTIPYNKISTEDLHSIYINLKKV